MDMHTDSSAKDTAPHVPVMLAEVLQTLAPRDGGVYADCTFGAGGYTRALLESADCTVYAIDRDPAAVARARDMAAGYGGRLVPLHGRFGEVERLLRGARCGRLDGMVLDIGVSLAQLDDPARGFSFRRDGPLDMRMGQAGKSAAEVVNTASERELADIIFAYGEERAARRIARRIVAARAEKPVETTAELARIVHEVLPMHGGMKTDTATRTFQALRIHVNDELGELDAALDAAARVLAPAGRLVVVTFHSLEDARVKSFLRLHGGRAPAASRHAPAAPAAPAAFRLERAGALKPSEAEVRANPRARSARLRFAVRTDAEAAHA